MSCADRWAHGALDRLFVGDLEAADLERLRAHVTSCESCSKQYDRVCAADARLCGAEVFSAERLAMLRETLLDRVSAKDQAARAATGRSRWWMPALGFALAAGLAAAVAYVPRDEHGYQARGGAANSTYGIRAFCLESAGGSPRVLAEALPGGRLKCAANSTLQLTYTAPRASTLRVDVEGPTGLMQMFPSEGGSARIVSGVDVPLSFSTPVTGEWLSKPSHVRALFEGDDGERVESQITLEP